MKRKYGMLHAHQMDASEFIPWVEWLGLKGRYVVSSKTKRRVEE